MYRKIPLINGEAYHVFNKSIAEYKIFNNDAEYSRIIATIRYYQYEKPPLRFSHFIEFNKITNAKDYNFITETLKGKDKILEIIAYCIMPTHIHLILKQIKENGISVFINNILNSYSRYFNAKHKRKGPLWEGRFKNILVQNDEQLLHLTRYIHLNPVTAYLVDNPECWGASSYKEYLLGKDSDGRICNYENILSIVPNSYHKFVSDRISYQRDLAKIKNITLE